MFFPASLTLSVLCILRASDYSIHTSPQTMPEVNHGRLVTTLKIANLWHGAATE